MRNTLGLMLAAALAALPSAAREISSGEAGKAALAWLRRGDAPLGASIRSGAVAEVRTASAADGSPLLHVVRMAGGGVVVTSAESRVTPVVAFLDADDAGVPLMEVLCADVSNRLARANAARSGASGSRVRSASGADPFADNEAAWAELLGAGGGRQKSGAFASDASISDLRVPALLTTESPKDLPVTVPHWDLSSLFFRKKNCRCPVR